jgi:uncharacterized protein YkwD
MINRVYRLFVCFAYIAVLANLATGQNPVLASSMPSSPLANSASDSACLVKYDSLTSIVCGTTNGDVLGVFTTLEASTSAASDEASVEKKQEEGKKAIREIEGVRKEYIYTNRIAYDEPESTKEKKYYSKMRKEPREDSKRLEKLMNGDKVRVLKKETNKKEKTTWYYVQIFKSHDSKNEGKEGWIETWIVDNENVPAKPTPSPLPTAAPVVETVSGAAATTQSEQPALSSGESEILYSKVNEYRTSHGLPPFERSERLCSIARERAPEIAGEVATGSIHSGFYGRGYGYPDVENAVGMGSVDANFNWWVNSDLHRRSILGSDLKYSCLECSNGNCVQIFSANP